MSAQMAKNSSLMALGGAWPDSTALECFSSWNLPPRDTRARTSCLGRLLPFFSRKTFSIAAIAFPFVSGT